VIIQDSVFIGPRVVFTNDKYPPSKRLVKTLIGEGAVIGANSTIIAGIKIGRRSVIAAGSVVTKDVPDEVVVAGNPARIIMSRDEYEEKKRKYETEDL
jgi:acetyltransferase-like isoleucine patch superfamily enzyme